ncbi:MAG: hypothetical protein ACYCTJ_13075, partial [Acidithiobacillus ferrooxidans]
LRRWYFLCVSDAITHDLLSPCPGRPFCTSEKSRIQRRSVTAYACPCIDAQHLPLLAVSRLPRRYQQGPSID